VKQWDKLLTFVVLCACQHTVSVLLAQPEGYDFKIGEVRCKFSEACLIELLLRLSLLLDELPQFPHSNVRIVPSIARLFKNVWRGANTRNLGAITPLVVDHLCAGQAGKRVCAPPLEVVLAGHERSHQIEERTDSHDCGQLAGAHTPLSNVGAVGNEAYPLMLNFSTPRVHRGPKHRLSPITYLKNGVCIPR